MYPGNSSTTSHIAGGRPIGIFDYRQYLFLDGGAINFTLTVSLGKAAPCGVAGSSGSIRLCSPLAKDLGTLPNVSYKYI